MDTLRALGQQETNMSLDNTPLPSIKHCADTVNARYGHGRPEHELVPSRYALKVGAIDVMVVSDGVLSLPGAMLGHNVDPTVRAAWLEDMFLPPDVLEWALNAVVVRTGGRTILIDAGIGGEFPDLPRAGQWAQRLEAAGIDPASVTDVVLTHMHMDHCGGLLAEGVKERLRPDLRVHVAAAEAEFWESPDFSRVSMPPGFPDALRRTGKRFLKEYHNQLRTFENEYEVAPGVVVQRTGGHTPGHSVVRLASGGDPRVAGGLAPVVPVRLPCRGRGRRLSLRAGPLGVLTACWVRAERDDRRRLSNWSIAASYDTARIFARLRFRLLHREQVDHLEEIDPA